MSSLLLQTCTGKLDLQGGPHQNSSRQTSQHVVQVARGPFSWGFLIGVYPQGALIQNIRESCLCKDLRDFDRLLAINNQSVLGETFKNIWSILQNVSAGATVSLLIERGKSASYVLFCG